MYSKPASVARFGYQYVIVATAAGVASILFLAISGAVLASRATLPAITQLPANILPGNPLPREAKCNWPPNRSAGVMYCHVSLGQNRVYITYDPMREMIIRSSVEIDRETIGDLLAAWGTPTGLKRSRWSVQVQWGSRYVYAYGRPFVPENPIFFVFYGLEQDVNAPWTGFANHD
jgi:hypothetical protein